MYISESFLHEKKKQKVSKGTDISMWYYKDPKDSKDCLIFTKVGKRIPRTGMWDEVAMFKIEDSNELKYRGGVTVMFYVPPEIYRTYPSVAANAVPLHVGTTPSAIFFPMLKPFKNARQANRDFVLQTIYGDCPFAGMRIQAKSVTIEEISHNPKYVLGGAITGAILGGDVTSAVVGGAIGAAMDHNVKKFLMSHPYELTRLK